MKNIDDRERKRLEIQHQLDLRKKQAERNKLGQFATPPSLAIDIVSYTKTLMVPETGITFLDPAIGTGAFISALYRLFPKNQMIRTVGYEIDPSYADAAVHLWKDFSLQINSSDFTKADPPDNNDEKFNLLICNPPYVRHHYLSKEEKERLQKTAEEASGIKASKRSGLYCHFLWISHKWLAENGLACWLIPSEFMSVNYGQQVRDYLLNQVTLLRIHCFTPSDVQFSDALVTSSVIWFRKSLPSTEQSVNFSYGGTLTEPKHVKTISFDELHHAKKWHSLFMIENTRIFTNQDMERISSIQETGEGKNSISIKKHTNTELRSEDTKNVYKLNDLFDIKRGLATGANNFFLLNQEQISSYQIPEEFLIPVLPNSRNILVDEIKADNEGNPILKNPLFLLACDLPESDIASKYPSLWNYLQLGRERRVNQTYLCSHRNPWYSQEKRPAALFVYSYMGRQKSEISSPFRFILNHSKAVATNAYHVLYPKKNLQEALCSDSRILSRLWEELKNLSLENFLREGRIYGGGLHKIEPKELASVLLEDLPEILLEAINAPHTQQNL